MNTIYFLENMFKEIYFNSIKSRKELLNFFSGFLKDKVVQIIDTHNTASFIIQFKLHSQRYMLKAEYGSPPVDTVDEIAWYKQHGKHVISTPKCYAFFVSDNIAAFVMKYLDNVVNLDDIAVSKTYSSEKIYSFIDRALNISQSLFSENHQKKVTRKESDELYIQKLQYRLKMAQNYPYIKRLLLARHLVINDESFFNINYYIDNIAANHKLRNYLTPVNYGVIHGDLHCGNILVRKDNMYIVDAKCSMLMPIEYDYGKIMHSIHGGYGLIMNENVCLTEIGNNSFDFHIEIPTVYKDSFQALTKKMRSDLMLRSLYTECMHFMTILPFHAAVERETVALYLKGIMLFKELFENLH